MTAATRSRRLDVPTPVGPARAHVSRPSNAVGSLVLGHGAGGGIAAPDLVAVRDAALAHGWAVALVEQPWRVEGRKVAPAPARLDEGWLPVVRALRSGRGALPGPLVVGGRSAGARVACRTAEASGAQAVVALAFPLHPPGRPEKSRLPELAQAATGARPVLVVQGQRDAFGTAEEVGSQWQRLGATYAPGSSDLQLVAVDGDHGLKADPASVAAAVTAFLSSLSPQSRPAGMPTS